MKDGIFRKAILLQDKLVETGSGHNTEFYEFQFKDKDKNIQVRLTIEDNKMTISDTSLHGTYYPDSNILNSYMLAVLYFKLKKQGG